MNDKHINRAFEQMSPTKEQREKFRNSYDWERMTKQDEAVWQIIFDHLAK